MIKGKEDKELNELVNNFIVVVLIVLIGIIAFKSIVWVKNVNVLINRGKILQKIGGKVMIMPDYCEQVALMTVDDGSMYVVAVRNPSSKRQKEMGYTFDNKKYTGKLSYYDLRKLYKEIE